MCLVFAVWRCDPRFRLVLGANRDEFHGRPAAPASFWADTEILAGQDLLAGGTWLGLTRSGRFAAITNYWDQRPAAPTAPSRGALVTDYLRAPDPPHRYLERLETRGGEYAGFSLLAGTSAALGWISNREGNPRLLEPGSYGLANAGLNSDWPKIARIRELIAEILSRNLDAGATAAMLLDALQEGRDEPFVPTVESNPDALEAQRRSRIFLRHPVYGTRASTVVLIGRDLATLFVEQTWTAAGGPGERQEYRFKIDEVHR